MSGRRSLIGDKGGAKNMLVIIIVVMLLASTVGAFLFITGDTSASGAEVKMGSKVKVDYIGKLSNGKVFDTSFLSVAQDNNTYLKSPLFTYRSGGSNAYVPLEFTVGAGTLIKGFEYGVLGMKVGQTEELTIPVSQGYGEIDPAKLVTIDLTETVPVHETMTAAEFKTAYGETAASQRVYDDPKYGWQIRVLDVDTVKDEVLIRNEPTNGSTYKAYGYSSDSSYGWDILIANVDPTKGTHGEIVVKHQLTSSDEGNAKGYDGSDTTKFVVQSIDTAAGTAVLNKNSEVTGVTLTFVVTIVSVD